CNRVVMHVAAYRGRPEIARRPRPIKNWVAANRKRLSKMQLLVEYLITSVPSPVSRAHSDYPRVVSAVTINLNARLRLAATHSRDGTPPLCKMSAANTTTLPGFGNTA